MVCWEKMIHQQSQLNLNSASVSLLLSFHSYICSLDMILMYCFEVFFPPFTVFMSFSIFKEKNWSVVILRLLNGNLWHGFDVILLLLCYMLWGLLVMLFYLLLVPQVQDRSITGGQEDGETEQHILQFDGSGTWW